MSILRSAATVAGTALVSFIAAAASAQSFPSKPIRILSTDPGGFLDITARAIATEMSASLGQPVIVENRPSNINPEILVKANPDGYTMAIGGGTLWITPLIQKVPYDPLKDFAPVSSVVTYPYVLVVHQAVPVQSVRELIDLAKAKPGVLNIAGTASPGGASFLSAELFKAMTNVNMVRVPYKGNAQGLVALLAGEVQVMFNDLTSVGPHVKSGKLKALAVSSLKPFPPAPDLPTVAASGVPGYESIGIFGFLAPAGTPAANINRLNREVGRVLQTPEIKERFSNVEIVPSTPAQFGATIKADMSKWAKVLKDAGVKTEL